MNHRKNIYKPGEYEVEIKWKGYDNCSNTWEDMREKILEVPDSFLEYYATTSSEFKDDFTVYLELNPELKQKLKWKNSLTNVTSTTRSSRTTSQKVIMPSARMDII